MSLQTVVKKVMGGLFVQLIHFIREHKTLTVGVFATIFTWGFVQELRRTLLSPVIRRHFIPKTLEIDTSQLTTVKTGELLAALIEWMLLMILLFLISLIVDLFGISLKKAEK